MASVWGRSCCGLGLAGTLTIAGVMAMGDRALTQTVVPDTTLGTENSTVVQDVTIQGILSDRIDGGAVRGINLFHSFLQFGVDANRGVYFTNPIGVENILTRVTGGNPSAILGRLGVLGNANLYLLNPNGIIFGPNASLDVQGSFIASTATGIALGEGEFNVTEPETSTLISVQPGTLFLTALATQQSSITNQANLTAGQGIRLVAGSVTSTGQLTAPDIAVRTVGNILGNAEVQSVTAQTANLTASTNLEVGTVSANTANLSAGGNLTAQTVAAQTSSLLAGNSLDVQNVSGTIANLYAINTLTVQDINVQTATISTQQGDLFAGNINAQNATVSAGGVLTVPIATVTTEATFTAGTDLVAGTINAQTATLNATRDLSIQSVTATDADLSAGNDLSAQTVTAQTATLDAARDLSIQSVTATDADLSAGNDLSAQTVTAQTAILNAGNNLQLTGSQFNVTGNLGLRADNQVVISDDAANPFIAQVGGNLFIEGTLGINIQLSSNPGSQIQVGGDLSLVSSNGTVTANAPFSVGGNFSISSGGNIELGDYTGTGLNFSAQGNISLGNIDTSSATGDGGAVALTTTNGNISVGSIRSFSLAPTAGNGGSVSLTATSGSISVAGEIDASAISGNAGAVTVHAPNRTLTVQAITAFSGAGNGGNVVLSANGSFNTADINTSSTNGSGGSINLSSTSGAIDTTSGSLDSHSIAGNAGWVSLAANSGIATAAIDASSETGNGGAISLTTINGGINTTAGELASNSSTGNGGNVSLYSSGSIATGTVNASSEDGNGGSINLTSNSGAINTTGGTVDSSSITGNGGNVSLGANRDIATAEISTASDNASGGSISLTSTNGAIDTTAGDLLSYVTTVDGGSGGAVSLQAANNVRIGTIQADGGDRGSGGNIRVNSDRGGITVVPNQEINSSTFGTGSAGSIVMTGETLTLNGANVDASTNGGGNGGNVVLAARNNGPVTIVNSQISTAVKGGATGMGGNIAITGSSVALNTTKLDASTNAAGSGGGVTISTLNGGAIELSNSTINGDTTATGQGGNIELTAPTIFLNNNSRISARTLGSGQGGSVLVNAAGGTVALADSSRISTAVDILATGTGGDINVIARSVFLTGGARLEALTRGPGNAGNIQITASDFIQIAGANPYGLYSGLLTSSETSTSGRGGNITINSSTNPQGTLRVADSAFLSARTLSSSAGGNIEVNVNRLELIGGGQLITSAANSGAAGNISVNATQGILVSGSNPNFSGNPIGAAPDPNGNGFINETESNNTIRQAQRLPTSSFSLRTNPDVEISTQIPYVTVSAGGDDSFDYYAFTVETPDSRGIFDIDTGANNLDTQVFLFDSMGKLLDSNDDAPITAGAAGSLDSFNSYLNYSFTAPGTYIIGVGLYPSNGNNGGETPLSGTTLPPNSTNTTSDYRLQVSIETNRNFNPNEGAASGLFAQSRGTGPAGTLTLTTPQLTMQNGAQATVSSTGSGNAGNLDVNARIITLDSGSKLAAETVSGGGGNIQLRQLETLQVTDNSQISASTVDGQGGTLSIGASRSIELSNGSGLFARALGDGTAGNLTLSTRQLTIQNQSEVSTSTAGRGSAGEISAQADSLFLTNGGRITSRSTGSGNAGSIALNLRDRLRSNAGEISASSEQGGGGNITITARDILLRNSSLISTRVSSGSGGGGNISITAKDIFIALEDSDILANAEDGVGGKINIQSPVFIADIFANVGQNPGKDFSRFRGNGQVDISASSRFGISGIVSIPDFTFLQNSLDRLSENFITPEQIVAGSCLAQRNVEQGSFIAVGTGGLPADPYGVLRSRYSVVGVQGLGNQNLGVRGQGSGVRGQENFQSKIENLRSKIPSATWKPGDPIQEAQGFMQTIDGRIVLGTDAQLAEIAKAQELICGENPEQVVGKHL
ncbi:filamentous hemagglutinin N-terminal domain-containing protein [Kovacikia minuta CCNUW1]|uniref:beta strand repeat-containing protein n=1 Tax=Kovacikia minuta TaxID=2931930 RepID=UPI001CCCC089|nr:filamentous hemagglutinin N-terminal domain-containing protein [Kovacikia minuta]UBF28638.1 filamentous hemagglutinin N-terminal domain-containing protein [Kovacikia minuta CCNUW1]